jgi:hypothetical protein
LSGTLPLLDQNDHGDPKGDADLADLDEVEPSFTCLVLAHEGLWPS